MLPDRSNPHATTPRWDFPVPACAITPGRRSLEVQPRHRQYERRLRGFGVSVSPKACQAFTDARLQARQCDQAAVSLRLQSLPHRPADAPQHGLGSTPSDDHACHVDRANRDHVVLRRSDQRVAILEQQKYNRIGAPVLAQGLRSVRLPPATTRRHRRRNQWPAAPAVGHAISLNAYRKLLPINSQPALID